MKFPILNISAKRWDPENLTDYIFLDEFIYTDKESIFKELYKDKFFIDCDGRIYKAVRKAELTEQWRNWFRFIPNIWKRKVVFRPTGENWTVDRLRSYLLERVSDLKPDKHTEKWKADLKIADNHFDLIFGQKTRHNNI